MNVAITDSCSEIKFKRTRVAILFPKNKLLNHPISMVYSQLIITYDDGKI